MPRILLKTTTPYARDEWHIRRFSLLHLQLSTITDSLGEPLFEVLAHDYRENEQGNDEDLPDLLEEGIEQLWLLVVNNSRLNWSDIEAINRFRQRGGALFLACHAQAHRTVLNDLEMIGSAFSELHQTFYSGMAGDYQRIQAQGSHLHPLLQDAEGHCLHYLPAHSEESALQIPSGCEDFMPVMASGHCQHSGKSFNLMLACDAIANADGVILGRTVLDASFRRFSDYHLDPSFGAPSFISSTVGDTMLSHPQARQDTHLYFSHIALWLAGEI